MPYNPEPTGEQDEDKSLEDAQEEAAEERKEGGYQ